MVVWFSYIFSYFVSTVIIIKIRPKYKKYSLDFVVKIQIHWLYFH
jgi:hypothetical protein